MRTDLRGMVVVLTGATTGIGRATARELARRGAVVVLAARNREILEKARAECVALGGRALAVTTDVREEAAVRELARVAFETFGRIDVWVNNAGVALYGRIEEAPYEVYRSVIDTNLLGCVHGVRAVLPYFRRTGRGVLINNASGLGKVGEKYLSAYVASKFGVVGLGNCLRQELVDQPDIHVCTLLPSAMDTPLFHHAGNYTGRAVQPMPPLYEAERTARAIVSLAECPRRQKYVGLSAPVAVIVGMVAPGLLEQVTARYVEATSFSGRRAPRSAGNILSPSASWTGTSGGFGAPRGLASVVQHARSALQIALLIPAVVAQQVARKVLPRWWRSTSRARETLDGAGSLGFVMAGRSAETHPR